MNERDRRAVNIIRESSPEEWRERVVDVMGTHGFIPADNEKALRRLDRQSA